MAAELRLDVLALSDAQRDLHARAVACAVQYQRSKADLLDVIEEVDRSRLIEALACGSTFAYCRDVLDLSETTIACLTRINRKAREVPELRRAVREGLAYTKAERICSVLTPENQHVWIPRAKALSKRELERLIAETHPRAAERESLRAMPGQRVMMSLYFDEAQRPLLTRAQDVLSNREGRSVSLEETFLAGLKAFLEAECPVRRADRNRDRANLSVRARVDLRDRGRCQMTLPDGSKCHGQRFVEHHHRRPKFHGGRDHPDNLVTLCRTCHQRWHRRENDVPGQPGLDSS